MEQPLRKTTPENKEYLEVFFTQPYIQGEEVRAEVETLKKAAMYLKKR